MQTLSILLGLAFVAVSISRGSDPNLPKDLLLARGHPARFDCPLSSNGSTVSWNRGGRQIAADSRFQILSNGSLFINATESSDAGGYQCIVATSLSRTATLQFAYLLKSFDGEPDSNNKTVILGSENTFSCLNSGSAPLANISWLKDGRQFMAGATAVSFPLDSLRTTSSLQLVNVTKADEGAYQCVVTNILLPDEMVTSKSGFLSVNAPDEIPSFVLPLNDLVVLDGASVLIECKVHGNPEPNISWLKSGGMPLTNSSSVTIFANGSLFLHKVTLASNESYSCVAFNRAGSSSSRYFTVKTAYWTSAFLSEPMSVTAIAGQPTRLQCRPPDSRPSAVVTWLKNFISVKPRPDIAVLFNGDLSIGKPEEGDEGNYRCSAENTLLHRAGVSKSAYLTILVPPTIRSNFKAVESVIAGKRLELDCSAIGDPKPIVFWMKDGQNLTSSENVTVNGGILLLPNASLQNEGNYSCIGSNSAGEDSASVFVEIFVLPFFTRVTGNLTVKEGENVTLTCFIAGKPPPVLTWTNPQGAVISQGNNLTLNSVSRSESGVYTCQAKNVVGTARESSFVTVQYRSKITVKPLNQTVIVRDRVILNCEAEGEPSPMLFWFHLNQNSSISIASGQTLEFANVLSSSAGDYECRALNSVGQDVASAYLTVYSPARIEVPPSDIIVREKSSVILPCQFSGFPYPDVRWTKNDLSLPSNRFSVALNGQLNLSRANVSDTGNYTCTVQNVVTTENASASITVQGLPGAPFNIYARVVSSSEVNILWTPPLFDGFSSLKSYEIHYRVKGSASWTKIVHSALLHTRYLLQGVLPYTRYEFAVAATNGIGTGALSNIFTALTNQSAPVAPVISSVIALNATSLRLAWLASDPLNGILQGYQMRYTKAEQTSFHYISFGSSVNQAVIDSLIPFTLYLLQMSASTGNPNNRFQSLWSSSVSIRTTEGVPLSSPYNLSMIAVNATTLKLDFMVPLAETVQGKLLGFNVSYWLSLDNSYSSQFLSVPSGSSEHPRVFSVLLFGLNPWSLYKAQVRLFNSLAQGPLSPVTESRTEQGVPSLPPLNISSLSRSPSSLFITWLPIPPSFHNGILLGYHVYIREQRQPTASRQIIEVNANFTSALLRNLTAFTSFLVNVAAFTVTGDGPVGTVVQMTAEGAPTAPIRLQLVSINVTSVVLTWKRPAKENGIILGYTIFYSSSTNKASFNKTTTNSSTFIVGLQPGTAYNASVSAFTSYGYGKQSNKVFFQTNEMPTLFVISTESEITAMSLTPSDVTMPPTKIMSSISTTSTPNSSQFFSTIVTSPTSGRSSVVTIACSCVGAVLFIVLLAICYYCCCRSEAGEKKGRYKFRHGDDNTESEDAPAGWTLGTGDNIMLKKSSIGGSTEMISFQDSYLPQSFESPKQKTKIHEKGESGHGINPMAYYEADAGSVKPKGRPPSMPGPSPYSSRENIPVST